MGRYTTRTWGLNSSHRIRKYLYFQRYDENNKKPPNGNENNLKLLNALLDHEGLIFSLFLLFFQPLKKDLTFALGLRDAYVVCYAYHFANHRFNLLVIPFFYCSGS